MPAANNKVSARLLFSSVAVQSRNTESFPGQHAFIHILAGSLYVQTNAKTYKFLPGDSVLIKKDQLTILTQRPENNQQFRSVSVHFDQQTLLNYSVENKIAAQPLFTGEPVWALSKNILYESYASSLSAYQQGDSNTALTTLKMKEALMLLLHLQPESLGLLFDFSVPGKADLEQYMQTNYRFNAGLHQFAQLSGRSLASFKRDFEKVFQTSPGKWLLERRLKEAKYLIQNKRMKISDVYLEVGFEDLSHFSFAFKNAFGRAPRFI